MKRRLLTVALSVIEAHGRISQYMIEKGYYHPSNLDEQMKIEEKASKAALKLAK